MNTTQLSLNRRGFLKQTCQVSSLALTSHLLSPLAYASLNTNLALTEPKKVLVHSKMGFNGNRQDPVTKLYSLGNGYRAYNPTLMRFHAHDSQSPFGKGGHNGHAYCLGDPVKNVARIAKVIRKKRVVSSFRRKNFASYRVTKGEFDTHKSLSHDQVVLRGISSLSSIASSTSSLVATTQTELGMNADKSNLASRILHFTGATTGYLGSQSLKVSQLFRSDPIAFSASRFSDFPHLAGLIGLLATEPSSDEASFFTTLTLLFMVNSTGTLKVQNHLKER